MLHDGVFPSFWRSQDSILSGKARVKYDSLMEASRHPGTSFAITPQDSLVAPKPARHTQVSPNRRRAEFWYYRLTNHLRYKQSWQDFFITDLLFKCKYAIRLQHAFILQSLFKQQSRSSTWHASSVGSITFTSLAASRRSSFINFASIYICPNAFKPNPNHRIENALPEVYWGEVAELLFNNVLQRRGIWDALRMRFDGAGQVFQNKRWWSFFCGQRVEQSREAAI